MDGIRGESTTDGQRTLDVAEVEAREAGLERFGHGQRKDGGSPGGGMLRSVLAGGRRSRGGE